MSDRPSAMLQNMLALEQLKALRRDRQSDDDRIAALYQARHSDQESQFIDRVHDAAEVLDRQRTGRAEALDGLYHAVAGALQKKLDRLRVGHDMVSESIDTLRRLQGRPDLDSAEMRRSRRERIDAYLDGAHPDWREKLNEALSDPPDPATNKAAHADDVESSVRDAVQEHTEHD